MRELGATLRNTCDTLRPFRIPQTSFFFPLWGYANVAAGLIRPWVKPKLGMLRPAELNVIGGRGRLHGDR